MIKTIRCIGGLFNGTGLLHTYRSMGSVAQGQTDFIAYKQSSIISETVFNTLSILKELELYSLTMGKRKWAAALIAFPLPFALQILNHRIDAKKHPHIKEGIIFVRKHLEHVAFAVDICCSVVFTINVAPYYGVGTLVGLSIEILNENKYLPKRVKDIWEKTWVALSFTRILKLAYIEDVDVWDLSAFIGEMSVFTWEIYFQGNPKAKPGQLKPSEAAKLLQKPVSKFNVNWSHVNINPNLITKKEKAINIESSMEQMINNVDWNSNNNLIVFKSKMLNDPRFKFKHPRKTTLEDISDDFAKDYFKKGAMLEAKQIAMGQFLRGDSYIRFPVLQGMLKSILHWMTKSNDTLAVTDDLFKMALNGGEYCATGHIEVIESIYKQRIMEGKNTPIETKALYVLNAKRQRWFDQMYEKLATYSYWLPRGVIDFSDIHFRNVSMFYFDNALKLHSEVVKNDMTTMEGGFCSRLYRLIFSKMLEFSFWIYALRSDGLYSSKSIVKEMEQININDFTQYWKKWIKSSKLLSEEQKEMYKDEILIEGSIFGEPLQIEVDKAMVNNPKLIALMLYDKNILS